MFDQLLNEVAARFGLSLDKAKLLLGSLIALIFNEKRGGSAGFVDLFRSRGLGGMVDSWLGDGPNEPISVAQLEQALGSQEIDEIARQTGVERGVAASALATLLPGAFNALVEDGRIPTSIPDHLRSFIDGLGDFFRDIGAGALGLGAAAAGGVAHAAGRTGDAIGEVAEGAVDAIGDAGRATLRTVDNAADRVADAARDSGIGKWLPWLLLAGLLVAALFWLRGCSKQEAAPAPDTAAMATETPAAISGFNFAHDGGKVTVGGTLASEDEKNRLMEALRGAFGTDNVSGDISINTATAPAGWMDKLIALLPDLKANGLKFGFDGDKLNLDTSGMSDADRFALSQKFRSAFSGFEISGLWDQAMAAFANLKDGFTANQLVEALDLSNVYFETGSATITRDSMETLAKAAEFIKRAPADTRIEISGHTDNTGDAAANMTLSQQRADAVMARLGELGVTAGMLTAKGYGQDKPVADNGTEEGRALNRRIDYAIAP